MSNEVAAICQQYLGAGLALVPLRANDKAPEGNSWNQRNNCITDISGLSRIQYGVGLAHAYCSEPTCCLDVDDVSAAQPWLKERGVDLDQLLTASDAVQINSGRVGRAKLLYKLPPGTPPQTTKVVKVGQKVALELRCASVEGKTVQDVLPPSIHPLTGRGYTWGGNGTFANLPVIPDTLLRIWMGLQLGDCEGDRKVTGPKIDIPKSHEYLATTQGEGGDFPEVIENIARVCNALQCLSADCSYDEWRDVFFALKSTGWSCAKDLAQKWSMSAPHRWETPRKAFESTWSKAKIDGGITIGTLFHRAAIAKDNQSAGTVRAARKDMVGGLFKLEAGGMCIPTVQPPIRDYLFAHGVMRGTVAMLAGLGGTAKTTLAMQLCTHAALGKPLGNLEVAKFSSLLFLGEEVQAERDRRFGAICSGMTQPELMQVQENVKCFPAAGLDLRLTWLSENNTVASGLGAEIIELAKLHEAECGTPVGLIVLDHARLVMAGDPNAAEDVTQLTRVLADIAIATNSAVLLLAHSPKSVHSKDAEIDASEIAGSSAFVDNARCAFVLHTMRPAEAKDLDVAEADRKEYVCLTTAKSNYGPTGTKWWFKKEPVQGWQTIKLVPVTLYPKSLFPNVNALTTRIVDSVAQAPGKLTERSLRDRAGIAGALKASEAEVKRTIGRLLEEGRLVKRGPTTEERDRYRLSPNVREVLDLG